MTIKNGVATVNLSTEFDSGGGTASMQYRLAQVVYTLTQFTTVKSVVFQIEGQTVTVFGSEGIVLDGPVGRADYADQLPAIFVDRPAYGAALGNPGRVSGNADVFEATFRIAILDGSGKTLADQQVDGDLRDRLPGHVRRDDRVHVSKAQWGTLRVYDLSAKDGTPRGRPRLPGLAHARRADRPSSSRPSYASVGCAPRRPTRRPNLRVTASRRSVTRRTTCHRRPGRSCRRPWCRCAK